MVWSCLLLIAAFAWMGYHWDPDWTFPRERFRLWRLERELRRKNLRDQIERTLSMLGRE